MSNAILDFKNAWYDQNNGSGNMPVTDNHKKIWEELWRIFEGWVNNGKYLLNKANLGIRIMQQPRKGENYRRLRQEPWLFVSGTGSKQNAIYVKIVMCNAGIRIGVDFYIKEAKEDIDIYIKAFKKCFSEINEGWQIENDRFSIYKLIEYKGDVADERYKIEFIELLARSIEQYEKVTDDFNKIKEDERQNSDIIEKNHSESDLFFFTLDKITKGTIKRNMNGAINLCGAEYLGKQLFCYQSSLPEKYFCDGLKWIRAGIATAFCETDNFENIKEYFNIGIDSYKVNSDIFLVNGNEIRIDTNADMKKVLDDAITAFDDFNKEKEQFKLIFKHSKKGGEKKWRDFESLVGKENILPYDGKLETNTNTKVIKKRKGPAHDTLARNRIIFGAPGTGKSNTFKKFLEQNSTYFANFERVTFHPEYSYYDFLGTYRPCMNETGKKIIYQFEPGPFARILKLARKHGNKGKKFLLVIEEINRARTAAVFGDTFQLLDRDENGESEYEIMPSRELCGYLLDKKYVKDEDMTAIRIPSNMYIWATMNSADQGVYSMDTAFKRRWDFEYLDINYGEGDMEGDLKDVWNHLRHGINGLLRKAKINEDKQMGPFFMKTKDVDGEKFVNIFKNKVLMYIYEDAAKHRKKDVFADENMTYSQLCNAIDDALDALKTEGDPHTKIKKALGSVFKEFEPLPASLGGDGHDDDSDGETV